MHAEGVRRAVVMFGPDWRKVCRHSHEAWGACIARGEWTLGYSNYKNHLYLCTTLRKTQNDIIDGSCAYILYYKSGRVSLQRWCQAGHPTPFRGGRPVEISYSENGEIEYGIAANGERLTPEQTAYNSKNWLINAVQAVLDKYKDCGVEPPPVP